MQNIFKVLHEGKCINIFECPVCRDGNGIARKAGEMWKNFEDPCVTSYCSAQGTIV